MDKAGRKARRFIQIALSTFLALAACVGEWSPGLRNLSAYSER